MALFGDERRFYPGIRESDGISAVYGKDTVGEHLGPGRHYERDLDDKRMGWSSSLATKREPMRKNEKDVGDRSDSYLKNQLTPSGLMVSQPSERLSYPSPGQYEPDNSADYATRMTNTIHKSYSSPRSSAKSPSYSMGTSPRMTSHSTILRDGFLVAGSGEDETSTIRGPGTYFQADLPTTTLNHKSSNVRSMTGNSKGAETAKASSALNTSTLRTTVTPRREVVPSSGSYQRHSPTREKESPSFGSPRYAINTPVLGSPKVSAPSTVPFRAAISHKGYMVGGPGGGYGPGVPEGLKDASQSTEQQHDVSVSPVIPSTPTGRGTPTGLYAATPIRHKSDR